MVKITEQVMRDGNQSLTASRITLEDMLPIVKSLDRVGFFSVEAWSGSLFECCMRFLNEDPWERLRKIKDQLPHTPIQTLVRSQSLLGFRIYADETVRAFAKYAIKNGSDVFSIFDALNDIRNMEVPIQAFKAEGGCVEACILYAINPIYTIEKFVQMGKELERFGSDFISIHDNAGILSPAMAFNLVSALKKELTIPVILHCHSTTGMALLSYYEGCRAGADILETAISPFSGGASLPATEAVVAAFMDSENETGFDLKLLTEIKKYFSKLWDSYITRYNRTLFEIDMGSFLHQLPSGMLSHLLYQLGEMKAVDRYDEILKEVPSVLKDFGYPPLATPSSQIVASQAAMNVLAGERYKYVTNETKSYVRGMYGQPPGDISEDVKEKILGKNWRDAIINCRPADLLKDEFSKAEEEAKELGIVSKPEDILTYIFYPKVAKEFLSIRRTQNGR